MVFPSAKNIYHVHSKPEKASALAHFVPRLFFRNLINIIHLKTAIMLPQCNRGSFTTQNRLFYRAKEPVLIYRGVEIFWSMGIIESWFPHDAKCLRRHGRGCLHPDSIGVLWFLCVRSPVYLNFMPKFHIIKL